MAYVFTTLQENHIVAPGDKIAIATPIFTPYLQIPVLEDFGFEVVELRSAHNTSFRFDDGVPRPVARPGHQGVLRRQPGQPGQPGHPARRSCASCATSSSSERPDLVIVADTVYATFVDGFRSIMADLPRHVICLHSFSKNFGATGNRLGFVAVHRDNVMDELLAAQRPTARRRSSRTATARSRPTSPQLPFVSRLVADSREVALHNIAGLGTPDQVQMALFALAYLMPSGARLRPRRRAPSWPAASTPCSPRSACPHRAARTACTTPSSTCSPSPAARRGDEFADWLAAHVRPEQVPLQLAREHGVVVLPGQIFDAESWDVRVSLASLTAAELTAVGEAIVAVLDAFTP